MIFFLTAFPGLFFFSFFAFVFPWGGDSGTALKSEAASGMSRKEV